MNNGEVVSLNLIKDINKAEIIKTGQTIQVDANRGVVNIIR